MEEWDATKPRTLWIRHVGWTLLDGDGDSDSDGDGDGDDDDGDEDNDGGHGIMNLR